MNKYNAKRVVLDGHKFTSKAEANRYAHLKLLERAGLVKELLLQPSFELFGADGAPLRFVETGRLAHYRADFEYVDSEGARIIEDVKGNMLKTDVSVQLFRLKRALMASRGLAITIVR